MKDADTRDLNLQRLLVQTSLLSPQESDAYMQLACFMGLPLSTVLGKDRKFSDKLMKVLVRLADLITEETLSLALAQLSIQELARGLVKIDDLLLSLDSMSSKSRLCKLGELLVDSGLVNPVSLGMALSKSQKLKKMLGQVLVDLNLLRAEQLLSALRLQEQVRTNSLNYEAAVELLGKTFQMAACAV